MSREGACQKLYALEGRKCQGAMSDDPTDAPLGETESRGGPEDSPKLTEKLEPQTPGGHSRVQDKPEGAPGPPGATTGTLPAASVGAKSELRARGEAWDMLG